MFSSALKSWGDLLLAAKDQFEKFTNVSLDSIQKALENFKQRLGVSISSTPPSPDVVQTNKLTR